jgi:hypothetical protein
MVSKLRLKEVTGGFERDKAGFMQLTVGKLETTCFREIELVPLVFCIRRLSSSSSQHRVFHII